MRRITLAPLLILTTSMLVYGCSEDVPKPPPADSSAEEADGATSFADRAAAPPTTAAPRPTPAPQPTSPPPATPR